MKKLEKNEVLLWFGSWTSKIGNIVFDYANSMSIVSSFSGKTWILALYQSSETIIQIIFNLIGGAKADKGSRKKIVIITDILAAIACAVLSFFVDTGCMAEVMICANAILAVIYAFNSPTYKSIIREMVKKNRIGFYNSVSNAGGELIGIAGPIIGVGLVQIIGTRGALLFDAGTFLLSAFAESLLERVIEVSKPENEKNNVISDIMDGFKYLLREKEILFLVILAALVNFFLAGYNLLLPYTDVMFENEFHNFYSKALVMEAIGGVIGSALCSKIAGKFKDDIRALILFLGGTGMTMFIEPAASILKNMYVCLVPFILFGIMLTCFNIMFMSHVQTAVDEVYLGRVFSIIFTVAVLFMPLGSFAFSFFVNMRSVKSYALVGGGIIMLSMIGLIVNKINKKKCNLH